MKAQSIVASPVAHHSVEIISAVYGTRGHRVPFEPRLRRKLTNRMVGSDPSPRKRKSAVIRAIVDGKRVSRTFAEGEKISFD